MHGINHLLLICQINTILISYKGKFHHMQITINTIIPHYIIIFIEYNFFKINLLI